MFKGNEAIRFGILFLVLVVMPLLPLSAKTNPRVVLVTTLGEIEVELFQDKAPVSVSNFLAYVREGFYAGTVFHRVIDGFMIQGGGFDKDLNRKPTKPPIDNEAKNGLSNKIGTLAYARTAEIKSATSQFFINLVDNVRLDHNDDSYGYAVFGKVIRGLEVVKKIGKVGTGVKSGMADVPVTPVVVISAKVAEGP